jgi:hypothetical protein
MKTDKGQKGNACNLGLLRKISEYAASCMPVTGWLKSRFQNSQEGFERGDYGAVLFPSAAARNLRYSCANPDKLIGIDLLYLNRVNGLDVKAAEEFVASGKMVSVVGEGISEAFAKDFLNAGARVNLVKFNPSSNDIYKSLSEGIGVSAVFRGYSSKLIGLKKFEEDSVKTPNSGSLEVYVVGNLSIAQVEDLRKHRVHVGLPFAYEVLRKTG